MSHHDDYPVLEPQQDPLDAAADQPVDPPAAGAAPARRSPPGWLWLGLAVPALAAAALLLKPARPSAPSAEPFVAYVYFTRGSAMLYPEGVAVIDNAIKVIESGRTTEILEQDTNPESNPPAGLAQRRAQAVAGYLAARGIDQARISSGSDDGGVGFVHVSPPSGAGS